MNPNRSLVSPAVAICVCGILAATTLLAEGVSLSRYILTITLIPSVESVDPDVIDDFCKDDDGCGVTIRLERAGSVRAKSGRFYPGLTVPLFWTSTPYESTNDILADADGTAQSILSQSNGMQTCMFSDGDDPLSFNDSVAGFILAAGTGSGLPMTGRCILVLFD